MSVAFSGAPPRLREIVASFDHTTSGAVDFGSLAAGESVVEVQVVIDQAFDDLGTLVSLGLTSNPDGILSTAQVDPSTVSTYGAQDNFLVSASDSLRLKVFPFTSTQGSGRVVAIIG